MEITKQKNLFDTQYINPPANRIRHLDVRVTCVRAHEGCFRGRLLHAPGGVDTRGGVAKAEVKSLNFA